LPDSHRLKQKRVGGGGRGGEGKKNQRLCHFPNGLNYPKLTLDSQKIGEKREGRAGGGKSGNWCNGSERRLKGERSLHRAGESGRGVGATQSFLPFRAPGKRLTAGRWVGGTKKGEEGGGNGTDML